MRVHADYRGCRFLDAFNVPAGQINITRANPGITVAFHRHQKQTDYFLVVSGMLEVIVKDGDSNISRYILKDGMYYDESKTYQKSEFGPLKIEPNCWHGFKCIGSEPAILMYYVTEKYNPDQPDEERLTPEEVGADFTNEVI